MKKLLLLYYTKTGTTKEISNEIKDVLESSGHTVDLKSFDESFELSDYSTIIIGSPVNGMMWHQSATDFISKYKDELQEKKVVYFTVSYTFKLARNIWRNRILNVFNESMKIKKPIKVGIFGGKVDEPLPKAIRVLFGIPKNSDTDMRDWDKIRQWSNELSETINEYL